MNLSFAEIEDDFVGCGHFVNEQRHKLLCTVYMETVSASKIG